MRAAWECYLSKGVKASGGNEAHGAAAVKTRTSAARRDNGYTLVEVLVALAILSVSLVAIYGVLGDSAYRMGQATSESAAIGIARARLEEVGILTPAIVGDTTGQFSGYAWRTTIVIYGAPEERVAWPVTLIDVSVIVAWQEAGNRRSVQVRALKIVPRG